MNKIEIYRKRENLTQEELAKKANVNRSHLAQIENGKFDPRIKTLRKLANALNCEVRDLI